MFTIPQTYIYLHNARKVKTKRLLVHEPFVHRWIQSIIHGPNGWMDHQMKYQNHIIAELGVEDGFINLE